jgi:ABC-2 type transport system ATP-binding protein
LSQPHIHEEVIKPVIRTIQLCKKFGRITAVDSVDLEVKRGETFGLLGPNGAGKTTTIGMLSGVLSPDSGKVSINGAADPTRPEVRRQLGIAPQALALYMELTGAENLAFFGRLYGLSGAALKSRVTWALEFAGLQDRGRDRVATYSGGMQRRLNLACALVHDPPVLLLDEPTVGVDPQSRNLIFEKIEQLSSEGRTILYTTHYMEEAERLCERVAIIDQGKILAMDTVGGLVAVHGGESTLQIRLHKPPENPAAVEGKLEGNHLQIRTSQPLEALARLASSGLSIETLDIERANLEHVFLNLTGRRLRD